MQRSETHTEGSSIRKEKVDRIISRLEISQNALQMKDPEFNMIEEEDTKYTKLFVGGIPYRTKDETLKEYFLKFDEIKEAVIIRERRSRRSKGYGFVTMATEEGAKRACENKKPVIDGREANVDFAYLGAKPKSPKTSQGEENETTEASKHVCECDKKSAADSRNESNSTSLPISKKIKLQKPPKRKSITRKFSQDSQLPPLAPVLMSPFDVVPANVTLTPPNQTLPQADMVGTPWYPLPSNLPSFQPIVNDQTVVNLVTINPSSPLLVPGPQTVGPSQHAPLIQDQLAAYKMVPSSYPGYSYNTPAAVWYVDMGGRPINTTEFCQVTDTYSPAVYHGGNAYTVQMVNNLFPVTSCF